MNMKNSLLLIAVSIIMVSCGGRSKEEQKAYTDSLFHVISSSPSIVAGPYTLEDQLDACDKLIKEFPNKKEEFEEMKKTIRNQIAQRDSESY